MKAKLPVIARLCVIPLCACTLLCGTTGCLCTRMRTNDPSIAARAKAIVPGRTKAADLKRLLGAEASMTMPGKDGTQYIYTYGDSKTKGLMLILVNFSKTNVTFSSLVVETDANGVVKSVKIPDAPPPQWEFWPFGD